VSNRVTVTNRPLKGFSDLLLLTKLAMHLPTMQEFGIDRSLSVALKTATTRLDFHLRYYASDTDLYILQCIFHCLLFLLLF